MYKKSPPVRLTTVAVFVAVNNGVELTLTSTLVRRTPRVGCLQNVCTSWLSSECKSAPCVTESGSAVFEVPTLNVELCLAIVDALQLFKAGYNFRDNLTEISMLSEFENFIVPDNTCSARLAISSTSIAGRQTIKSTIAQANEIKHVFLCRGLLFFILTRTGRIRFSPSTPLRWVSLSVEFSITLNGILSSA